MVTHEGTKHIQLSRPYTWAPIIYNRYYHTHPQTTSKQHRQTLGHQQLPNATAIHVGTNHIHLPSPRAQAANHTQLPQPHTLAPTTSNWHHQTRGHKSHPIATATHAGSKPYPSGSTKLVGTNHIQFPWPHTCRYQTHPTAAATHACTNHIQPSPPDSWAQITSNCHSHTRGLQTHSTVTAIHVGPNHIQPLPPHE